MTGEMYLTNQKEMLIAALAENGETLADIESTTLTEAEMNKKFDAGYGAVEGCEFTVWTRNRVYFPVEYDGAESVGSVSRNPDGKRTPHIG